MKSIKTLSAITIAAFMLMSFFPAPAFIKNNLIEKKSPQAVKVRWEKESYDFGDIEHAKPVTVNFTFSNQGDEPILVSDVVTSCGCTASDYTKEPILPGKSSSVKVTYNAAAIGAFTKKITVNFNDPTLKKVLMIKGNVK
jgi:hypothetical protein